MSSGEGPANNDLTLPGPPVRPATGRLTATITGGTTLAAAWFALGELGIPALLGLDWRDGLVLAVALGAVLGRFGRGRPATIAAAIALSVLLVVQWIPGPAALGRQLIRSDSLPPAPVDAIVVLSASITADGLLSPVAVDRLDEGIRLHRLGAAPRLILSRLERNDGGRAVNSDADQRRRIAAAAVAPDVRTISPVGTTRLEATRTRNLAEAEGWRRVIVVTTPSHTKRACAAFEATGLLVTCRASPDRRIAWSRLESGHDRAIAFGELVYETLGWWEYRVRGWIVPGGGGPAALAGAPDG